MDLQGKNKYLLYREKIQKTLDVSELVLRPTQKKILLGYIQKNKKKILRFLFLIFVQIFLELGLLILGRIGLYSGGITLIRGKSFAPFLIVFLFSVTYGFVSFYASKMSQELIIGLTIYLRRIWVSLVLREHVFDTTAEKSRILAKVMYHLSLLQSSLQRVLQNGPYVILSVVWFFAFIPNTNSEMLIYLPFFLFGYVLLIFLGYVVAKKYVSKEQTFSSQIIQHIFESFSNSEFIESYNQQKSVITKLDNLSELDFLFRVKRNLWLHIPSVLLFSVLTFFMALTYIYKPSFAYRVFDTPSTLIASGIVIAILVRVLYKSLQLGLSLYPMKLGACIGIPQRKEVSYTDKKLEFDSIEYRAKKVKLDSQSNYYKKLSIKLQKGDKVFIKMGNDIEEASLTRILSFSPGPFTKSWAVVCDGKWALYRDWLNCNPSVLYLNPQIHFDMSILEAICGTSDFSISLDDIDEVTRLVQKTPQLHFIYNEGRGLASHTNI